jgi:O-antigen ligase
MLAEKPITGFGPNSFYNHYRPYAVNRFETWVSDNPEHSTVHNYFLLVALEQGIVGLILFCLLFFGMLLHLQKLYHQFQSRFYQMVSLTTGVVLVIIGTINAMSDMIETDKIGGLFWLCLGMTILLKRKLGEERELLA